MKIVVAHPAQQHSYRLASALKKDGKLYKYITTVYYRKYSLTFFAAKVLKGGFRSKAEQRTCRELDDENVLQFCEAEGLLKLLCLYLKPFHKFYNLVKYHTADRFAKKVAAYAIKHKVDMVITYDDSSPILFEILKEQAPDIKRVLDVSAANRLYMRKIYDRDMELAPAFSERLKRECSIVWDKNGIERNKRELQNSQYFLVPSDFVARSLRYSGIKDEQILYCPYGVDISMFACKNFGENIKPIKFVYVGVAGEYKGISYLIDAFNKIPSNQAHLTIIGSYDNHDNAFKTKENISFAGRIMHDELPQRLMEYDVFIFPSLGDSFSLSAMEAAACGLPLIVTENTGMCDRITEGVEGFVVPIQSDDALLERIKWFVENPEKIIPMGKAARKMAERFSWNQYYKDIPAQVSKMSGGGVKCKIPNRPLRFVYVGGIKELKGIYYLLEAFKKIDQNLAKLTIVGNSDCNTDVLPYFDYVDFTGYAAHSQMPGILLNSDVFVFPSLGEGMSLSVLEAAASGLPLIISENSGIADKITEGVEGFIISIQSVDEVVQKVNWFIKHPDQIAPMGERAREFALKFSWEAYYGRVAEMVQGIEQGELYDRL